MSAIGFEAIRLVMTQVLLSGDGQKMDPMVSLYYYAPVCALMNFVLVWFTEMATFKMEDFVRVGPFILIINASVAFLLNLASLFLVSVCYPEAGESFTNLYQDRKDEQPGADLDRNFQIHPPCRGRGISLGLTHRLASTIRLQFGTRGPYIILCAVRNHTRVCGTDEERARDNFTIVAISLGFHNSAGDLSRHSNPLTPAIFRFGTRLLLSGEGDTRPFSRKELIWRDVRELGIQELHDVLS